MIPCFTPFFGDLSRQRLSADIATSQGCFVSPKRPQTRNSNWGCFSSLDIRYNLPFSTPIIICGLWRCTHSPNYPNHPILSASPIAFSEKSRYICVRKLKVTHSSFIKLAERGLDGLTPLIRWPSGSARLSKSTGQRIYFRCFCCNILINSHLIIVIPRNHVIFAVVKVKGQLSPKKGSPLSNLLKIVSVDGLTPYSGGHRESARLSSLNRQWSVPPLPL